MNKKLLYIATMLLMVLGFSSCDDDKAIPPVYYPEQIGDGTGLSPYSVGTALTKIYTGDYTSKQVFVKGIVSQVTEFGESYGNITYYISDDGTAKNELEVYRGLGLNGEKFTAITDLSVGDEVIIACVLTYYNNTYAETGQGAIIVSLNGSPWTPDPVIEPAGSGLKDDPYNVTKALEVILSDNCPTEKVFVSGIISKIDNIDTSFGNATYYISDTGSTYTQLEVYRGYSLGGAKFTSTSEIKVGDEIVVYGQVVNFNGTPEFTTGSMICKLGDKESYPAEGSTAEPKGDGSQADPYNVAKAQEVIASLGADVKSEKVYIEGTVSKIESIDTSSFGNATYYISDDGTAAGELMVYRGYYFNGDKFTAADQLKVGDKVVIYGELINFKGNTPEVTQGSALVTINGQGSGTPAPDPTPGGPKGSGTQADPYNAAKALEVATSLAADQPSEKVYVSGIISSIKEVSTSFGNATYAISDDGTTAGEFSIYRCYYIGGEKFTAEDQIKVGDKVLLYGALVNFKGNTPQMAQGGQIVSVEGGSVTPDPGPTPDPDGPGSQANPYTVAKAQEIIAAGSYTADKVYIKGKISAITEVSTSFGNATYAISDDGSASGQLTVFRGYYFNGDKFTAENQIKVGDEVVILGALTSYNGKPQVNTGSQIITLNGKTSSDSSATGN